MTTADVGKGFHLGLERAAAYLETMSGLFCDDTQMKDFAAEIRRLPQEDDLFGGDELDKAFDRLWATYPMRCGSNPKKPAKEKYVGIIRRHEATIEEVRAGAECYARAMQGKNPEHIKQMVTWLNQHCWTDPMWQRPQAMEERPSLFNAVR